MNLSSGKVLFPGLELGELLVSTGKDGYDQGMKNGIRLAEQRQEDVLNEMRETHQDAIERLREQLTASEAEISRLKAQIDNKDAEIRGLQCTIEGMTTQIAEQARNIRRLEKSGNPKKPREMSAAAVQRIALAQKYRWAKFRKGKGTATDGDKELLAAIKAKSFQVVLGEIIDGVR